jgi:hypothetical protein
MRKASKKGSVAWRLWGWIFLIALAFVGGFVPTYFRAEQLEKQLNGFKENYYQQRVASSISAIRETLVRCQMLLCQGNATGARKELERFYSQLETLSQDPVLRNSSREAIRTWMKTRSVNLADIHPPRLTIQERLRDLEKDLTQLNN